MKKNQGFSLVELIVVIAIMAVLVGVLAPAYLKYVEKSRKSSDVSSLSDIMGAAEKLAVDVQYGMAAGDTVVITVHGNVSYAVTIGGTSNDTALTDFQDTAGTYTMKSSEFKVLNGTITATVQKSGAVVFTQTGLDDILKYSADFKAKFSTNS